MKYLSIVLVSLSLLLTGASYGSATTSGQTTKASVTTSLTSMPLAFTENQGQWDEQVLFRAYAGGATMWFTKDGAYYQFTRRIRVGQEPCAPDISDHDVGTTGIPTYKDLMGAPQLAVGSDQFDREPDSLEIMMIKAIFMGANPNPHVIGEGLLEYKCNYFLGNDPGKWRTDVPNYRAIVMDEVYHGIDLSYYGEGHRIEYDFRVSPGADYSRIRIRYEGAENLSVSDNGALVVKTDWGEIKELAPVAYHDDNGTRKPVAAEYLIEDDMSFRFRLGDGYNPSLPVVIDPVLAYSTYLGGSDTDWGWAIAVDATGAAYVTGRTASTDFPIFNPFQTDQSNWDVFITKVNSSGSSLVYSTYLGGNNIDEAFGITVGVAGSAYVTGGTSSTNFPTLNPYQAYQGSVDAFVTKLSVSGSSLVYSTYLGGSASDYGEGIAVDTTGETYVSGRTASTDFPTFNPLQINQGGMDVFVTKLNSSGSSLVYSTYLGGSSADESWAIVVDAVGAAYVIGTTGSSDFPTLNPYQTDEGGIDVFVTKLNSSGENLIYSTYLGGDGDDYGKSIAVDAFGAVYVTGGTNSTDFPTLNPFQTDQGNYDVFVTKLDTGGSSLIYSSYLGGNLRDFGRAIAVDTNGAAYVTGYTYSTDFPTLYPYQTFQDVYDVFITKLRSDGSNLVYSTYFGGSSGDLGWAIAVDTAGSAYVTGWTLSDDFPTLNPYQTNQGKQDVYVTKLLKSCCNHDEIRGDVNYDMSFNVADLTYLVDYLFRSGPPPPCPEEGDVNGDNYTNVADLTYLVDCLLRSGPPPPPCP